MGGSPSPSHARDVPRGDSAGVGVRLTPDGGAECSGHEPAERSHPGRPGPPGTACSALNWSQRRPNPAEPMQKSGPSPEEGRNRHHVVPGGGTGTPGCSAGRACPGRAPWREMEQRRALRGMRGAGGAPKRLGQHSGGAMHGSVGRPPKWATPGFLRSWDESGGDRLRVTSVWGAGPQAGVSLTPPGEH